MSRSSNYDLFGGVPPHQKHSKTSKEAAVTALKDLHKTQREVLQFFRSMGNHGATDEEVQKCLDMNPSTERPRRRELFLKGYIKDSGQRRKTLSGRNAVVWIARSND